MPDLLASFISVKNPTGAEPVPDAALMNDTQNLSIPVETGKTYFIRIINMAAFAGQYLWFEGHTMRIVEVDGVYTEPTEAEMIYITAAQRYSILLTTKNDTSSNFAIVGSMDQVSLFPSSIYSHTYFVRISLIRSPIAWIPMLRDGSFMIRTKSFQSLPWWMNLTPSTTLRWCLTMDSSSMIRSTTPLSLTSKWTIWAMA